MQIPFPQLPWFDSVLKLSANTSLVSLKDFRLVVQQDAPHQEVLFTDGNWPLGHLGVQIAVAKEALGSLTHRGAPRGRKTSYQ